MSKITGWLTFRRPYMATGVLITMLFLLVMLALPIDFAQKFAWLLAIGIAFAFLSAASKFMKQHYAKLALLLFSSGLVLVLAGVVLTPADVFAASALEDAAAPIIGGVAGFFASASEDE